MLSTRIPGSALLLAALGAATACASSSSPGAFSRAQAETPAPRRPAETQRDLAAILDSVRAQAIADEVAPKVSVHATVTNIGSSRRVRANLRVDDDAYILVGHLGADGTVRVVFPLDPQDNGFVRGGRSYDVPEFFAGFEDEFRYRAVYDFRTRSFSPARYDSYDGGTGYVFVIASWRPMHFEQLDLGGGRWVSFDVADEAYLRDPRPAIYELATLLVGGNREASSVEFARYYGTYYTPMAFATFNASFCLGNEPFGYGLSSFGPAFGYRQGFGSYGFGSSYGSRYGYGSGCGGSYYRPPTYGLAQGPFIPSTTPSNPFPGQATLPVQPRPRATPMGPGGIEPITVSPGTTSPEYRRRGLITAADDAGPRAAPRRSAGGTTISDDQPPSIQERVNRRRVQETNSGAQAGGTEYTPRNARERVIGVDPGASPPRDDAARPRVEPSSSPRPTPRSEARDEPRSAPRAEPVQPRAEPRAEPRAAAPPSTPPAARTEPRSEPRAEPRQAEPVKSAPPTPPPAVRPITPITPG